MKVFISVVLFLALPVSLQGEMYDCFADGTDKAEISFSENGNLRQYVLKTTAELRDNRPADKARTFAEDGSMPYIRSGSIMFDGLYAMALDDARLNAVEKIRDSNFTPTSLFDLPYYQTGEKWTHVWTRDVSYAIDLGLATLDQQRCINSLLFKTAYLKPGITGDYSRQIVQDTGSGGSYPVSTDRVVWAFGAEELLKYLDGPDRENFLNDTWEIVRDTIEHDRKVIFDESDGLYRGEQSFLDWRVQSYPKRTGSDVVLIAQSKSLSTNIGHYWLLKTGEKLANKKGMAGYAVKYRSWAGSLHHDINRGFYLEDEGQYSSLILEDYMPVKVKRYDTLGQSLAVLSGIADKERAAKIVANYPHGKYGPAVIWPQDKNVPIYHNQGIWPFVTAYWLKAARQVGNAESVDLSVFSLIRGAALNLSNMENFDFVTGKPYAKSNGIEGPVINSQRQLWSVAGYIAMVQDVIFGLETGWDGIKFLPYITPLMHKEYFCGGDSIELNNFRYKDKRINIKIYLPSGSSKSGSAYLVDRVVLNGKDTWKEYVDEKYLTSSNTWEIWLSQPLESDKASVKLVHDYSGPAIFGPTEPDFTMTHGDSGKVELQFANTDSETVCFNVYKNGELFTGCIESSRWIDSSAASNTATKFYAVEAEYQETGNVSFLTETLVSAPPESKYEFSADKMHNVGGNLVNNHHFENWGLPGHALQINDVKVNKDGHYFINVEYSNGSGQIYTGVTCAVKRVDIIEASSGQIAKSSYLVMPETAPDDGSASGWEVYKNSTRFSAELKAGASYNVRIYEDEYSRNMSYFDHYIPYTRTGGGESPYNYVNISELKLLFKQ